MKRLHLMASLGPLKTLNSGPYEWPIADAADRGELHYPYLFETLVQLGYAGIVGCEYNPVAGTLAGLNWFHKYKSGT